MEAGFGDKKCQFFVEIRHLFAAHTGGTGKKSNAISAKKGHFLAQRLASKHALRPEEVGLRSNPNDLLTSPLAF